MPVGDDHSARVDREVALSALLDVLAMCNDDCGNRLIALPPSVYERLSERESYRLIGGIPTVSLRDLAAWLKGGAS